MQDRRRPGLSRRRSTSTLLQSFDQQTKHRKNRQHEVKIHDETRLVHLPGRFQKNRREFLERRATLHVSSITTSSRQRERTSLRKFALRAPTAVTGICQLPFTYIYIHRKICISL